MFSTDPFRRAKLPRTKESVEYIEYCSTVLRAAVPVHQRYSADLSALISSLVRVCIWADGANVELLRRFKELKVLDALEKIYSDDTTDSGLRIAIVSGLNLLQQNLRSREYQLAVSTARPVITIVFAAVHSQNDELRAFATAFIKGLGAELSADHVRYLHVDGTYPFLEKVVNMYICGKDQKTVAKTVVLASLQLSCEEGGVADWLERYALAPFVSYMCFEVVNVAIGFHNTGDGPLSTHHDPALISQLVQNVEYVKDILAYFGDISAVDKSGELEKLVIQRLIELVIGPLVLVPLQLCRFSGDALKSLEWPLLGFSVAKSLELCLHALDTGSTSSVLVASKGIIEDICNGPEREALEPDLPISLPSDSIDKDHRGKAEDLILTQSVTSASVFPLDDVTARYFEESVAPALTTHVAVVLLTQILEALEGTQLGMHLYRILFRTNSHEELQDIIASPWVTNGIITLISTFDSLSPGMILLPSAHTSLDRCQRSPAPLREWTEYIARFHARGTPVLIRLLQRVLRAYVRIRPASDVFDQAVLRLMRALKAYDTEEGEWLRLYRPIGVDLVVDSLIRRITTRPLRTGTFLRIFDILHEVQDVERQALLERQRSKLRHLANLEEEACPHYPHHSPLWRELVPKPEGCQAYLEKYRRARQSLMALLVYEHDGLPYGAILELLDGRSVS